MRAGTAGRTRIHGRRLLAALALAVALLLSGGVAFDRVAPAASAATASAGHDAATRHDDAFNRTFSHGFAKVGGVRMHYVTGGRGEPLVLLHGWPQSWYEWRGIMPRLAQRHRVIAVDLPGLGDSRGAPPSYDKATLARYVHRLVAKRLGHEQVNLAAHDLGAGVAFQYAAQFPAAVERLVYMDYPLPGPALTAEQYETFSWHIAFHRQPDIPEAVVGDDVRTYLRHFYPLVAYRGTAFGGPGARSPFTPAQVTEYARTYRRPQVLRGGFELYRTLDEDARDTIAADPIATPTLVLAATGALQPVVGTLGPRATNIERAVEVPRSGHWLPEENPRFVAREMRRFLAD